MANFVAVEVDRHPLSSGGWVEIKRNLNIAEQRRMETLALVPYKIGNEVLNRIDWSQYEILRAELWLTDWLMLDSKDKPRDLSLDAIKALDPDVFEEISGFILARILVLGQEKKTRREVNAKLAADRAAGTTSDQTSS